MYHIFTYIFIFIMNIDYEYCTIIINNYNIVQLYKQ